jgi:hypothetical protein
VADVVGLEARRRCVPCDALEPRSRGAFFARVNGNRNRPGFTETRLRAWAAHIRLAPDLSRVWEPVCGDYRAA